jgi:hypothetical protein
MPATATAVTPAKAGVQEKYNQLDSRLRGNDSVAASSGVIGISETKDIDCA